MTQNGPGQPMTDFENMPYCRDPVACAWIVAAQAEIRRLRAAGDARYRAGIEAAAKMFDRQAEEMEKEQANPGLDLPPPTQDILTVRGRATAIRALADAPKNDLLLPGLRAVHKEMQRMAVEGFSIDRSNWTDLCGWIDDEIAKRGTTKSEGA